MLSGRLSKITLHKPACLSTFARPQSIASRVVAPSSPSGFLLSRATLERVDLKSACPPNTAYITRSFATTFSKMASATSFYGFETKDKKGKPYPLAQHQGKVILAVNTASKCGFTPQFGGLENLWKKIQSNEKYKNDFLILGFPCNQFGGQDPGSDDQIQEFCQVNYGVTFPVLGKTEVNGNDAEPVWEWMKAEKPGLMGLKRIKWNFEKFLIGRDGRVIQRWASTTSPEKLEADIMKELEKSKPAAKAEL